MEIHHCLYLNVATHSDLHWWKYFLEKWHDVSLMSSDTSSLWGCGAFCNQQWFSSKWGECSNDIHITIKEVLPIVVACTSSWRGKQVFLM